VPRSPRKPQWLLGYLGNCRQPRRCQHWLSLLYAYIPHNGHRRLFLLEVCKCDTKSRRNNAKRRSVVVSHILQIAYSQSNWCLSKDEFRLVRCATRGELALAALTFTQTRPFPCQDVTTPSNRARICQAWSAISTSIYKPGDYQPITSFAVE
jgi:hypothetical protein